MSAPLCTAPAAITDMPCCLLLVPPAPPLPVPHNRAPSPPNCPQLWTFVEPAAAVPHRAAQGVIAAGQFAAASMPALQPCERALLYSAPCGPCRPAFACPPPTLQILYHPIDRRFVLFFHLDTPDFEVPAVGIAVSPDIRGASSRPPCGPSCRPVFSQVVNTHKSHARRAGRDSHSPPPLLQDHTPGCITSSRTTTPPVGGCRWVKCAQEAALAHQPKWQRGCVRVLHSLPLLPRPLGILYCCLPLCRRYDGLPGQRRPLCRIPHPQVSRRAAFRHTLGRLCLQYRSWAVQGLFAGTRHCFKPSAGPPLALYRSCPVMRHAISRLRPDWLDTVGSVCSSVRMHCVAV